MNHLVAHGQASCTSCVQPIALFPTTVWVVLMIAIAMTLAWVVVAHLSTKGR